MKTSIKIIDGKLGWGLKINGLYLNISDGIKLISCPYQPHGMTEFVSIESLRKFWCINIEYLVNLSQADSFMHYESINGNLIRKSN
jgi:hypothetical protein